MSITIRTESGRMRRLPDGLDLERVAGLDPDGRIVVDDFDARNQPFVKREPGFHGYLSEPFMFGLTLCCNASDKGCEDGVYCRACYGGAPNADEGNYLFKAEDGSFPGLDPIVKD